MQQTIPDHVPSDRIFSFDLYKDPRFKADLHVGLASLRDEAPDLFYTPENGGHWVATRYDLIDEVVKDHDRFSACDQRVPRVGDAMVLIPINLDPPEHTYYRTLLMGHFAPAAIKRLEPRVQYWAHRLVADVASKGACDFVAEVGSLYPVSIFMELMGLPMERLREYRAQVVEYFDDITPDRRKALENLISSEMREVIEQRRVEPRDDLISKLLVAEHDGRRMTQEELERLCNLLFQAGMDTVANFAAFFFRYLAMRPALQRRIREHPEAVADVVEEGFRMLGVVNNGRLVRDDTTLGGVQLRANDMVVCMLSMGGIDDRRNPNPGAFEIERPGREHMLFSKGVHLCIGHTLARAEMRALVAEWFAAIPEFRLADGYVPEFRAGNVMGLSYLPLEWTPK